MICTVTNSFTGTITARGGGGTNFGGAGTIYINGYPATTAQLVSDNGGNAGAYTLIAQSPFIFPNPRPSTIDLTVSGAASAIPSSSLSLRNLFIASNSWLIASELSVSSNITVQSGGGISADSAGLHGGQGAGHVISSAHLSADGQRRRLWGPRWNESLWSAGGNSYGDFQGQFPPGSGGGATVPNAGGAGGGSLLVTASTLQLDGKISADGGHATNSTSGGGSGGGVQLIVTKLSGSGIISASGGSGGALGGGGGGGGRIALNVDTNLFTGSLRAWGGDGGGEPGGAGTVYINNRINQHIGKLILDNGDLFGADTPLSNPGRVDLSVKAGAIGSIDGFASTPLNNLTIGADGLLTTGASATNLGLIIASNAVIELNGATGCGRKRIPSR